MEKCIVCGEPIETQREGRIHDGCYIHDVVWSFFNYSDDYKEASEK